MAITQIKILGILDYCNDDLMTHIVQYVDDTINKEFKIEIVPMNGITFFRIIVDGEFTAYTVRKLINLINNLIGNSNYDAVQVILTSDGEEKKYNVDGDHDIVI